MYEVSIRFLPGGRRDGAEELVRVYVAPDQDRTVYTIRETDQPQRTVTSPKPLPVGFRPDASFLRTVAEAISAPIRGNASVPEKADEVDVVALLERLKGREDLSCSDWERNFLRETLQRYEEWGPRIRLSSKQLGILVRIDGGR